MNKKFDVIYDSHCFYCVVFEEDRNKFLKSVYASLAENGIFILDTMVINPSDDSWLKSGSLKFDKNYILWHKVSDETHLGVTKDGDYYWCPQRRIYPAEKVLEEIKENGFTIKSFSVDGQGPNKPFMLRAMCIRA